MRFLSIERLESPEVILNCDGWLNINYSNENRLGGLIENINFKCYGLEVMINNIKYIYKINTSTLHDPGRVDIQWNLP